MPPPVSTRDLARARAQYAHYLFHATISSTRLDGTPVYTGRRCQIAEEDVENDPGFVEIMPEASSAMAPLLRKVLMDLDDADYQHGDLVTLIVSDQQDDIVPPPLFHVLRVLRPPFGIPGTECSLARVDMLWQTATWIQRITADMPNTVRTASWDPNRSQIVATTDGTFGVGLQRTVNGVAYNGYLPGVSVTIAINEYAEATQVQDIGLVDYEHPVLVYEQPLQFAKGDVLALADGRRLVVADLQHRLQRMGVILAILQLTEWRKTGDIVYSVPL